MEWTVLVDARVRKDLKKAPRHVIEAFGRMLQELRNDPARARPALDIRRLVGRPGSRVRLGGWRAIVMIDPQRREGRITAAGKRGATYQ